MPVRAALKELKSGVVSALMNSVDVLKGRSPHHGSNSQATTTTTFYQQPRLSPMNMETRNTPAPLTPVSNSGPPTFQRPTAASPKPESPSTTSKAPTFKAPSPSPATATPMELSAEEQEHAALLAEIDQFKQQNAQLLDEYAKLCDEMKRKKIDSFEGLQKQDKELFKMLLLLMEKTEPMPMEGHNVGLFGITSTGKSTLINALLGEQRAETGMGETTTSITPYEAQGYVLWDFPGRNDEVSYFSMQYISFLKGLSTRLVVIQATVKENSSLMKLLDANGLKYSIVVNKFDQIDDDEREGFQKQIRSEVEKIGLTGVEQIYFVSAREPDQFPDWRKLVNQVQND